MSWSVSASGKRDAALESLAEQAATVAQQIFPTPAEAILASQALALLKLAVEAQPAQSIVVASAHGSAKIERDTPVHSLSLTVAATLPAR